MYIYSLYIFVDLRQERFHAWLCLLGVQFKPIDCEILSF